MLQPGRRGDRHGHPACCTQRRIRQADQLDIQRNRRLGAQRQTAAIQVGIERVRGTAQHHRAIANRWGLRNRQHLHAGVRRGRNRELRPGPCGDREVQQLGGAEFETRVGAQLQWGDGPADHTKLRGQPQAWARLRGQRLHGNRHRGLCGAAGERHRHRARAGSVVHDAVADDAEGRKARVDRLQIPGDRGHLALAAIQGLRGCGHRQTVERLHFHLRAGRRDQRHGVRAAAGGIHGTAEGRLLEDDRCQAFRLDPQHRGRGNRQRRQDLLCRQRLDPRLCGRAGRRTGHTHAQRGRGVHIGGQDSGGRQPGVQVCSLSARGQGLACPGHQGYALRVGDPGAAGQPAQLAAVQTQLDIQQAGARQRRGRQANVGCASTDGEHLRQPQRQPGLQALCAAVCQRDRGT